ncbi:Prenylated rab acceptor PRA1 [Dillenia turbinata]|uniref:PRA1 family protein n=1 Tax=Dillenia turbinata TaxID=194707 RepID=A0AAN8W7J5_9MAGN
MILVFNYNHFPSNRVRERMAFRPNPLSLSVPETAFESWLRDTGYLEVLDQRTSDLHSSSSSSTTSSANPKSTTTLTTTTTTATPTSTAISLAYDFLSRIRTLLSLFTLNPFAKLTTEDFSPTTPSWTLAFFGSIDSYSFPSSSSQARLRVHENVKRYARNYAVLFIVFFACTLYQMPLALLGLISTLALWDMFKFSSDRWGLDKYPTFKSSLIRLAQCATAVILFVCDVQMALFCALCISYAALILHASFRKLTPAKQPAKGKRK